MPALVNARWEMFSLGLASGKSQLQSYRDAGFQAANGNSSNACILAKRPEVAARVAELIEDRTKFKANFVDTAGLEDIAALDQAAREGVATREWIITKLMDNAIKAADATQFAASNQALKMLGEDIGMFGAKTPGGENDPTKTDPKSNNAISVDAVNRLLESVGYQGPAIDLSKIHPPALKIAGK